MSSTLSLAFDCSKDKFALEFSLDVVGFFPKVLVEFEFFLMSLTLSIVFNFAFLIKFSSFYLFSFSFLFFSFLILFFFFLVFIFFLLLPKFLK